ncbi:MAG: MotA/TolQ/ExbB proton channel family protein [Flavobacteriales bacterium]|nr:MotA/TolQ/ExbB proton channel family protein [Flavobacteriales bacterium]
MILLQADLPIDSLAADSLLQGTKTISILELLTEGSTIWVIIPLFILSIVAIFIFIERFGAIQSASKENPNFLLQIKDFIYDGKVDAAKALCAQTGGPYARMLEKGILRIGKPLEDIRTAIENVGKLEIFKLEKNLATLATIAGAAPMIGFLGTVLGMMLTFHEMKISGQAVKIDQLSGGIMQALVTTVAGLIIGIIAYIAYNLLVAKVEKVVHKMENTTLEFMDILQEPA